VVARLNDVFLTGRQSGKYFTTFYGAYDRGARSLAYCNAATRRPCCSPAPRASRPP
jgi:hypothetical protein